VQAQWTSFIGVVCRGALVATLCLLGTSMTMSAKPTRAAQFKAGKDVKVVSASVGPKGARLKSGTTGTPIDGIEVEIPEGAVSSAAEITLSYNLGHLTLPSGTTSDVFLRISASNVQTFDKPVFIYVPDRPKHPHTVPVAYAIDENGRLHALAQATRMPKENTIRFMTLSPLLFTWVYAPL
jgi:hypothetical protein